MMIYRGIICFSNLFILDQRMVLRMILDSLLVPTAARFSFNLCAVGLIGKCEILGQILVLYRRHCVVGLHRA